MWRSGMSPEPRCPPLTAVLPFSCLLGELALRFAEVMLGSVCQRPGCCSYSKDNRGPALVTGMRWGEDWH